MPLSQETVAVIILDAEVEPDFRDDFNTWYNERHMIEICALPGVLSATRLHNTDNEAHYLTLYELSDPSAFETPEFLAWRDGSDDTREMMSRVTSMSRIAASVIAQHSGQ